VEDGALQHLVLDSMIGLLNEKRVLYMDNNYNRLVLAMLLHEQKTCSGNTVYELTGHAKGNLS